MSWTMSYRTLEDILLGYRPYDTGLQALCYLAVKRELPDPGLYSTEPCTIRYRAVDQELQDPVTHSTRTSTIWYRAMDHVLPAVDHEVPVP